LALPDLPTAGQAQRWAARQLVSIADRPHIEAERLLAHVLHKARTTLLAHPDLELTPQQASEYACLVDRRSEGTPLPYLIGEIEFYGLAIEVTPDVLIPRPETELLVELALNRLSTIVDPRVVEVGTGSGCIAVALAIAAPALHLYATDLSCAALAVARHNAERHGVVERIAWIRADLLTAMGAAIDLIVSNPPYVAASEWQELPQSVRQEPQSALVAGPEGTEVILRLLHQACGRLTERGCLLVEIGERQSETALTLARAVFAKRLRSESQTRIHQDLAGKDRVLEIRLSGPANEPSLE
jgi:release factor glutamine methyltransferase